LGIGFGDGYSLRPLLGDVKVVGSVEDPKMVFEFPCGGAEDVEDLLFSKFMSGWGWPESKELGPLN
jgi:hypothetical protein